MPIYVYGCNDCGAVEEHIQRFSDPALTECERCGGRLEKQVTAAAFQLKGGGWYKDGYASAKADKAGAGADSSGSSGSKDSSGSKGSGSGSSGSGSSGSGSSGSGGTSSGGTSSGGTSSGGSSSTGSSARAAAG